MSHNAEAHTELRERNRRVIEYYFSVPHNSPEQLELYAPDCVWEQPFFRPGEVGPLFPAEEPEAEAPPFPEGFEIPEFTPEWHWGETKIYATEDPNYFFAENDGWGMQLAGDGKLHRYENYYFHTFRFNNAGKIDHYREITNPLNLMNAMGCSYEPLPRPEDTIGQLIELYEQGK